MITLKLELVEVNSVLNALGQMPFVQVQLLIKNIQDQAQPQVSQVTPPLQTQAVETKTEEKSRDDSKK